MKKNAISVIVLTAIILLAGGVALSQNNNQQTAVKVPVLVYHSVRLFKKSDTPAIKKFVVPPTALERELKYLKDHHYNTITMAELAKHISSDTPVPPQTVVLCFDDAWQNQYDNALPLLKKYGYKATFFVFTNAIGAKNFLTLEELKTMEAAGMEIGGHSKSHPYLIKITDMNKLRDEIAGGKKIIEDKLGHQIYSFATPYGTVNSAILTITKDAKFTSLRTDTELNSNYSNTSTADKFVIRGINTTDNLNDFVKILDSVK